jgi:hypothetical protein
MACWPRLGKCTGLRLRTAITTVSSWIMPSCQLQVTSDFLVVTSNRARQEYAHQEEGEKRNAQKLAVQENVTSMVTTKRLASDLESVCEIMLPVKGKSSSSYH